MIKGASFPPSDFMLDLEYVTGEKQTLQDYVKREPNYDLAFCKAWKQFKRNTDQQICDATELLSILDQIHDCALSHLPQFITVQGGDQHIHGKASLNWFGFSKGVNSNAEGVREIIKKIWVEKDDAVLKVHSDDKFSYWLIKRNQITFTYPNEQTVEIDIKINEFSQEILEKIYTPVIELFDRGTCNNGSDRIMFFVNLSVEERLAKATKILREYCKQIKEAFSEDKKIEVIAITIRDLSRLHIYYDGNARSLYILANILLKQNGLQLFYPTNMCIFDGCSIKKLKEEFTVGQKRFTEMFGDDKQLTKGLEEHEELVEKLNEITADYISEFKVIKTSLDERNFNLLLRQSAFNNKLISLLKFLLDHSSPLKIDPASKGKKGNALEIATKSKNAEAIEQLQKHGFKLSQKSSQ